MMFKEIYQLNEVTYIFLHFIYIPEMYTRQSGHCYPRGWCVFGKRIVSDEVVC